MGKHAAGWGEAGMEKRAANRRQAGIAGSRIADVLEQVIPIRSWNGEERPQRSRQWIIWHVLEHDIHHGGELSSILGAHGLAAVDLA
jgi:uncharacterized damage-inducible protein DinB